jgi:hypothetical protein
MRPVLRAAVAMTEGDAALEDVGVVARVFARRVGRGNTQQRAEVGDEQLVVGELGAVGMLPAGEEGLRAQGGGAGWAGKAGKTGLGVHLQDYGMRS